MKNILAKFLNPKGANSQNAQVIEFDKILYIQLEKPPLKNENLEEYLFEKACDELGIKEGFNYAMSYILNIDKSFVFLTLYENLEQKFDFAFCEALVWRNLNKWQDFVISQNKEIFANKTKLSTSYAVLVLRQNYGFVAFFEGENLLCLKNIPQFSLDYLQNKDQDIKQNFLEQRLYVFLKPLFELYECKSLVFINDEFNFAQFLSNKLQVLNFKLGEFSSNFQIKDLVFLQMKREENTSNFLRHKIKNIFLKRLVAGFLLSFLLGFIFPICEFYVRQNDIKNSFLNLNDDLNQKELRFDDLEKQNTNNTLSIEQMKARVDFINKELKPMLLLDTLQTLFSLIYQNRAKIVNLELKDREIKILMPNDKASAGFIKELYLNSFFTLKNKELLGDFYELSLELKNE